MTEIKSFISYARKVSRRVDERKARKEVYQEIYSHLLESRAEFIGSGMAEGEAEHQALLQMGEAGQIGEELDDVHTPKIKWGQILLVVLILAITIACIYGYFYWQFNILNGQYNNFKGGI